MVKSTRNLTLLWAALASALAGCSSVSDPQNPPRVQAGPLLPSVTQANGDLIPRAEPPSRTGNPDSYVVFGRRYRVQETSAGFREQGIASWYGRGFHGRKTSSGPLYNMFDLTAAHKVLPIPTYVQVTNLENGRQVVVKVTDRGPFVGKRIIDLSYAAASRLDMLGHGTAQVEIVALQPYQFVPELAARRARSAEQLASQETPSTKSKLTASAMPFAHDEFEPLAVAKTTAGVAALEPTPTPVEPSQPTSKATLQAEPASITVPVQVASVAPATSADLNPVSVATASDSNNKLELATKPSAKSSPVPAEPMLAQTKSLELDAPVLDVPAVRPTATKQRILAAKSPVRSPVRPASQPVTVKAAPKPAVTQPIVAKAPTVIKPNQNQVTTPLRVASAEPLVKGKRSLEERRTTPDTVVKNTRPSAVTTTSPSHTDNRHSERATMTAPRESRKAATPSNHQELRTPSRAAILKPTDTRLAASKINRSRLAAD